MAVNASFVACFSARSCSARRTEYVQRNAQRHSPGQSWPHHCHTGVTAFVPLSMFPSSSALAALRMGAIGLASPLGRLPAHGIDTLRYAKLLPPFAADSEPSSPQRTSVRPAACETVRVSPLLTPKGMTSPSRFGSHTRLPPVDASLAADSILVYPDGPSRAFITATRPPRAPPSNPLLHSPPAAAAADRGEAHDAPGPARGPDTTMSSSPGGPGAASQLNPLLGPRRAAMSPAAVTDEATAGLQELPEVVSPPADQVFYYTATGSGPARLGAGSPLHGSGSPVVELAQPTGRCVSPMH